MDPLLTGKVVLVIGGTSGVGAAIARAAIREQAAAVVITGRSIERGQQTLAGLENTSVPTQFVAGDISDPRQAGAMVRACAQAYGRVDALVNSAGLTTRGTLLDTTPELFEEHIGINLRGPFFTMAAAVADMRGRGAPGTILNIITMSAHGGQPYLAPYVAAKAGLIGLTKNAAYAHRHDRIRINGLNIGWTRTEGEDLIQRRFHDATDGWAEQAGADLPMGRIGDPDEIADAAAFLLSERSGIVTGSVIDWDQHVSGAHD